MVLEDYLAVRPERASELSAALRDGRLEAGPWFVLPDELIPGGEGLVRNLLAGARTLRDLRAEPATVLYCPDSFGHPAALPDIAAGFGKALIILWRGCRAAADTFHWRGRATRALTWHLSRSGYELGANLPTEPPAAAARWTLMRAELAGRATTGVTLLMNGADHHAKQRNLGPAVDALRVAALPDEIVVSSLGAFARALEQRVSGTLAELDGELRDSYGYTWTLQGTLASRAHQKRQYAGIERALVRDTEPWVALSRLRGAVARHHLTRAAWRDVLLCQPHDSLCGCSTDAVARAVDQRLERAGSQARGLREDALLELLGHDREAARVTPAGQRPVLLVRNPAARPRSGVAVVELVTKLADAPVGPGSRPPRVPKGASRGLVPAGLACQVLDQAIVFDRTEAPRAYPDNDLVLRQHAAVWVSAAPAYGVLPVAMEARAPRRPPPEDRVRVAGRSISNSALTLTWTKSGVVSLQDRATRRTLRDLVTWESRADRGDLYTPSIRGTRLRARHTGTRVTHRGPLRAGVEQRWRLSRGKEWVEVIVGLSLDAGATFVRITISGDNHAMDHRLRAVFRCDAADGSTVADAAFGPVDRRHPVVAPKLAAMEKPIVTAPLHRYVSRFDDTKGVTLYSDGLAEYESVKGGIAVTLVRCVGELSRVDLAERPGHAGWPEETPAAQCPGNFGGEFALLMHGARSDRISMEIERTADDALLPLTGGTLRSALAMPGVTTGWVLEGDGLAFSAAKESERDDWIVLRCVNLLDHECAGRWRVGRVVREAVLSRLDETPLERLEPAGDTIAFHAAPRATVTILFR